MPHNTKEAKNIFVRNVSEDDHKMLDKLRIATHEKHNTGAVMTAGYRYLNLLETEKELNEKIRISETKNQRLTVELEHLQKMITEYISMDERKAQMQEKIMLTITQNPDEEEKDEIHE